jgi:hypothetical protein
MALASVLLGRKVPVVVQVRLPALDWYLQSVVGLWLQSLMALASVLLGRKVPVVVQVGLQLGSLQEQEGSCIKQAAA